MTSAPLKVTRPPGAPHLRTNMAATSPGNGSTVQRNAWPMVRRISQPTSVSTLRRPGIYSYGMISFKLTHFLNSYGGGTCHDNTVEKYFYPKHFNSHYATSLKETQGYNTKLFIVSTEQECAKASLKDEGRNAFYFLSPTFCYLVNIRNEPMKNTVGWVAWASSVLGEGSEYPCHPSNAINKWVSCLAQL